MKVVLCPPTDVAPWEFPRSVVRYLGNSKVEIGTWPFGPWENFIHHLSKPHGKLTVVHTVNAAVW